MVETNQLSYEERYKLFACGMRLLKENGVFLSFRNWLNLIKTGKNRVVCKLLIECIWTPLQDSCKNGMCAENINLGASIKYLGIIDMLMNLDSDILQEVAREIFFEEKSYIEGRIKNNYAGLNPKHETCIKALETIEKYKKYFY